MKRKILILSIFMMLIRVTEATFAQTLAQAENGPYIVNSNSRGFPTDSMYTYKGELYLDWVYTVPYKKGNFKCLCDTTMGYKGGLFDKFMFAVPDGYTTLQAKQFQKRFIQFLMWDEKSNDAKINWQNEYNIKKKPQKITEFLKEIYVVRPKWVDSCLADFNYLCNEFAKAEKNGMSKGRIPYDAICLTHLAEYSNGEESFDQSFLIRNYYVIQDLSYLQYGYYRNRLDSIGLDILKSHLKTRKINIGSISTSDGRTTESYEREIQYLELADWEIVLPQLKLLLW